MSHSTLKMTRFEVERMASSSARSRAVPYLINTFRGKSLGSLGYIVESALPASNDAGTAVRLATRIAGHFSAGFGLKQLLTLPVW